MMKKSKFMTMAIFALVGLSAGSVQAAGIVDKVFIPSFQGAVSRTQINKLGDTVTVKDAGVVANGTADDSAKLQAVLNSGARVVDGLGLTMKINSSVTIPANVTFRNFALQAGTAGMNMVLVNSGARLDQCKLTGTGTVSIIERAVYPATDGASDVSVNCEVSNITVGVHAQPLITLVPKRWKIGGYFHNIVGTSGASEGYGVLLSPAESSEVDARFVTIKRHAVYLSAGASFNRVVADIDGVANYAVQLSSFPAQPPTQFNEVRIKARNLSEDVAGQGGAVAIIQKSHYNVVIADHVGNNGTDNSVLVEGSAGGPYPLGNKIVDSVMTGQFKGVYVVKMINADSTVVSRNKIDAYATSGVIGMLRAGTNGTLHGGYVYGNSIDALGQAIRGIYDEITAQPSYIGINDVRNNGAALRVDDQSGGLRTGYSREYMGTGTVLSVGTGNTADLDITLPGEIRGAGRYAITATVNGGSVQAFGANLTSQGILVNDTTVRLRAFNGHSLGQNISATWRVTGD